ncbi:MAG: hypothetical protein ABL933_10345 [Methyloglobulus sp.]
MPRCALGERERFPHHAPDPLPQGVVPPFHVRGLASLLADALVVALFGKDAGVGLPEITEGTAVAVGLGYPGPERPAGRLAPVAVDVGHYLPRSAAFMTFRLQRRPRPHFVAPFLDVATGLVKLKHVINPCGGEPVRHLRQPPEFFLATRSRSGATPRTCAKSPAGSTVPGTPA